MATPPSRRWNITPTPMLCMTTSKGQSMDRGKRVTSQWRNLMNPALAGWSRSTTVISHSPLIGDHLWGLLSKNLLLHRTMRKASNKPMLKDSLQNSWPGLFGTVKVIQTKERLRNCPAWRSLWRQDNWMQGGILLGGVLGQQKDMLETKGIWITNAP